jgi:hypothetical protein
LSKKNDKKFTTSSCNRDAFYEDDSNFTFKCKQDRIDCNADDYLSIEVDKESDAKCCSLRKCETGSCSHYDKLDKIFRKFKHNIDKIKKQLDLHDMDNSNNCLCTRKKFQDVQVSTEEIKEFSTMLKLNCRNVETSTEDMDDSTEITVINDISLCNYNTSVEGNNTCTKNVNKMVIESCNNAESVGNHNKSLKICKDVGTNTLCIKLRENATQSSYYIKNKKSNENVNGRIANKTKSEFEKLALLGEKNILNKKYPLNGMYTSNFPKQLHESSWLSSQFFDNLQSKIGEIASISAKIRKQCTIIRKPNGSYSDSDRTLNTNETFEQINIEIDLESSLVSFKSTFNKSVDNKKLSPITYVTEEEKLESISKITSFSGSQHSHKNFLDRKSRWKKCIVNGINSSVKSPTWRTYQFTFKDHFSNKRSFKTFCCYERFSESNTSRRGEIYTRNRILNCDKQKNRRVLKPFYIINRMSNKFTKRLFITCKKVLCCIVKNIAQKGKTLNDYCKYLREPRCQCYYCSPPEKCSDSEFHDGSNFSKASLFHDYCSCRKRNNLATRLTRLTGGTDANHIDRRRWMKECGRGFFLNALATDDRRARGACGDLNYYGYSKIVGNCVEGKWCSVENCFYSMASLTKRQVLQDRVSFEDYSRRCQRIEAFTSKWTYPYGRNFYYLK